jgi:serine/threonine protein kinase
MALTVGAKLGSHEITALLGKGGMGEVYRARDTKLKREVAIKILPDEFSHDPARVSRFQREAEVLASLNHPNIAAIYDLQEANGSGAAQRLTKIEPPGGPQSEMWSPTGNMLLFSMSGPPRNLWTFSPGVDEEPKRLMEAASYSVSNATFSPDGKWIAYLSGELGENEVFVQPFPLNGTKYRISTGGGQDPV